MPEEKIDHTNVIGVYSLCNTGSVLLHWVDYEEYRVLASINGLNPEWYDLTEEYMELTEEMELGFRIGDLFIPLCEVMYCTS